MAEIQGKRIVECDITSVSDEIFVFYDDEDNLVGQWHTTFNEDYGHRYVPGDTVCEYDESSGAYNVWTCPPAPEGNWCCTVNQDPSFTDTALNTIKDVEGTAFYRPECVASYKGYDGAFIDYTEVLGVKKNKNDVDF